VSPEHESVDRSVVAEVLRPVIEGFLTAGPAASTPEGLRDRKKRLLRQLISDTATALFLERGFDEVTVSEIAEACDVSEKTVFNYFPTKEALLLDREEYMAAMLAEALRDRGDGVSLTEAVVAAIEADVNLDYDRWAQTEDPLRALAMVRRFAALIQETPALQAALQAMNERLTQVAARTLADRRGSTPKIPSHSSPPPPCSPCGVPSSGPCSATPTAARAWRPSAPPSWRTSIVRRGSPTVACPPSTSSSSPPAASSSGRPPTPRTRPASRSSSR